MKNIVSPTPGTHLQPLAATSLLIGSHLHPLAANRVAASGHQHFLLIGSHLQPLAANRVAASGRQSKWPQVAASGRLCQNQIRALLHALWKCLLLLHRCRSSASPSFPAERWKDRPIPLLAVNRHVLFSTCAQTYIILSIYLSMVKGSWEAIFRVTDK